MREVIDFYNEWLFSIAGVLFFVSALLDVILKDRTAATAVLSPIFATMLLAFVAKVAIAAGWVK